MNKDDKTKPSGDYLQCIPKKAHNILDKKTKQEKEIQENNCGNNDMSICHKYLIKHGSMIGT